MPFCAAVLEMEKAPQRKTRDELGMAPGSDPDLGFHSQQNPWSEGVSEGGLEPPRPCGH